MTAIPTKASFTGASVTQGGFKTAHDNLIDALDERLKLATTAAFLKTASGVGITASPDGTFHVRTATAGAVTAQADSDDLVVENSTEGGISILTPDANFGTLTFGSPTDATGALVRWKHSTLLLDIGTTIAGGIIRFLTGAGTDVGRISAGTLFLGDSGNGDMTVGLTVNQATADDEILAGKSDDVTHGRTSLAEDDTYFSFRKKLAGEGGLEIRAVQEDAANTAGVLLLYASGGTASIVKDENALAVIELRAEEHNGSNAVANITANGNVLVVRAQVGGALRSLFLVDEDGDLFADGGTTTAAVTVFDGEEDVALCRAFDLRRAERGEGQDQIVRTEWDDWASKYKERLVDLGVMGADGDDGGQGLVNITQLQRLHNGAICQLHSALLETKKRLALTERRLAALPAN